MIHIKVLDHALEWAIPQLFCRPHFLVILLYIHKALTKSGRMAGPRLTDLLAKESSAVMPEMIMGLVEPVRALVAQ